MATLHLSSQPTLETRDANKQWYLLGWLYYCSILNSQPSLSRIELSSTLQPNFLTPFSASATLQLRHALFTQKNKPFYGVTIRFLPRKMQPSSKDRDPETRIATTAGKHIDRHSRRQFFDVACIHLDSLVSMQARYSRFELRRFLRAA